MDLIFIFNFGLPCLLKQQAIKLLFTMFNFNQTDKNNNPFAQFPATLVSIKPTLHKNANGTNYYWGTIKFMSNQGQQVQADAIIYENNYVDKETGEVRMSVGNSYLAKVTCITTNGNTSFLLLLSHLTANTPLSADIFGFNANAAKAAVAPVFTQVSVDNLEF